MAPLSRMRSSSCRSAASSSRASRRCAIALASIGVSSTPSPSPRQRRLRGAEPGGDLFALLLLTRFANTQPPHQRREREPLAEQRDKNDAVRESDDGVAAGEGYAGCRHGGDCGSENEGVATP